MLYHRALGRDLDKLIVAVVDNRTPMLAAMRAMLAAIGTGRIDTYESPTEAIEAMATIVPDLVIAAASMQPLTGPALVRTMRRSHGGPLTLVPAMIMSAHAKPALVADALRAGAHQVLVLPTSASTLYRRLDWLLHDDRPFELKGEHYIVAGMEERLSLSFQRPIYAPAEPGFPLPESAPDEEPALALYLAQKARVARN
jgi:DNA-binding NarL/FixJ family response regulator